MLEKPLSWNTRMTLRSLKRRDYLKQYAEKASKILDSWRLIDNYDKYDFDRLLKEGLHSPLHVNCSDSILRQCLPWARERWGTNKQQIKKGRHLVSYTKTFAGHRIIRGFVRSFSKTEIEAYETVGNKSCPCEAVWLPAVMAGYPSLPAFPFVLAHDETNPNHASALKIVSAFIDAGLVSEEAAQTRLWINGGVNTSRSDWDYKWPMDGEDF